MKPIATIDFETLPIKKRPDYPPKPVGVSIIENNKAEYLSWGHPEGNNCTFAQAKRRLKQVYSKYRILCHNGKYDLEVGEKHCELPLVPPHGWEDSMLLAFLYNPREINLKLKPLAMRHLKMKSVEQDKLEQWLIEHVFTSQKSGEGQVVIQNKKPKGFFKLPPTKAGAFVAYAPASLAGKYANGDTKRTLKLYNKFYKYVVNKGMLEQYDIEKRCIIKAIEMEREGINIDYKMLEPDLIKAKKIFKQAENAVQKTLGDINLNSPNQKIEAFERKGLIKRWEKTEKGNPKTSIDSLMRVCTDKKLVQHLDTYSKYSKLIGTYMQPWLNSALENNGKFFPWFNTIKGDNDKGTYTGRFSSNFQQVPREPKDKSIPFLRNYIIADKKSHLLFNRDYSNQEVRILAHFEDGVLLAAFIQNPELDGHGFVNEMIIIKTGTDYGRPAIKACNFLMVYGGGPKALARNLDIPLSLAEEIFEAHGEALPGVADLKDDLRVMARNDELFKTAGGRWYDFEEGFEYVALNTLIQGSAADHSKRGLLNVDDMIKAEGYDARIMLQVHDEFMCSGPKRQKVKFMKDFKAAMEQDKLFDLPMLSDGKIGERWGQMQKVK